MKFQVRGEVTQTLVASGNVAGSMSRGGGLMGKRATVTQVVHTKSRDGFIEDPFWGPTRECERKSLAVSVPVPTARAVLTPRPAGTRPRSAQGHCASARGHRSAGSRPPSRCAGTGAAASGGARGRRSAGTRHAGERACAHVGVVRVCGERACGTPLSHRGGLGATLHSCARRRDQTACAVHRWRRRPWRRWASICSAVP